MPLRPYQFLSMSHSRWTPNSASTQPVSMFVPLPLPQTSSVPVSTALAGVVAAGDARARAGRSSRTTRRSRVVLMVSGFGPLIQPVPVPSTTSSRVESTAPVVASVITCSWLGIAPRWPVTTVS